MPVTPDTPTSSANPKHLLIYSSLFSTATAPDKPPASRPCMVAIGSLQISLASFTWPPILHTAARIVSSKHRSGHVASLLKTLSQNPTLPTRNNQPLPFPHTLELQPNRCAVSLLHVLPRSGLCTRGSLRHRVCAARPPPHLGEAYSESFRYTP